MPLMLNVFDSELFADLKIIDFMQNWTMHILWASLFQLLIQ